MLLPHFSSRFVNLCSHMCDLQLRCFEYNAYSNSQVLWNETKRQIAHKGRDTDYCGVYNEPSWQVWQWQLTWLEMSLIGGWYRLLLRWCCCWGSAVTPITLCSATTHSRFGNIPQFVFCEFISTFSQVPQHSAPEFEHSVVLVTGYMAVWTLSSRWLYVLVTRRTYAVGAQGDTAALKAACMHARLHATYVRARVICTRHSVHKRQVCTFVRVGAASSQCHSSGAHGRNAHPVCVSLCLDSSSPRESAAHHNNAPRPDVGTVLGRRLRGRASIVPTSGYHVPLIGLPLTLSPMERSAAPSQLLQHTFQIKLLAVISWH